MQIEFSTLKKLVRAGLMVRKVNKNPSNQHAKRLLSTFLTSENGIFAKINQLWDFNNLNNLSNNPELNTEQVREILKAQWNKEPSLIISDLEESKFSGSIAQVNFAKLITGEDIAIKILYPKVKEEIDSFLKIFNLLPKLGPVARWGFPLDEYKKLFSEIMPSECDFNLELTVNKIAFSFEKKRKLVRIPKVFDSLSNSQVLVMERINGLPLIQSVANLSFSEREILSINLFNVFASQILVDGYFQTDWNQGNILLSSNNEVSLVDFGSWMDISISEKEALKALITNYPDNEESCIKHLENLGFSKEHLLKIKGNVVTICRIIFHPFHANEFQKPTDWDQAAKIDSEVGDLKWWFRSAGPAKVLLLIRAWYGFLKNLEALNVPINMHDRLQKLLQTSITQMDVSHVSKDPQLHSKLLHILLTDLNDIQQVSLEFPARSTEMLGELMGQDLYEQILAQGIDASILSNNFIQNDGPVGVLYEGILKNRKIRIWTT